MNKKMSVMGVGGKIAAVLVLSVAVTLCISYLLRPLFKITDDYQTLVIIAVLMIAAGFILNLVAAFNMLRAYKKEKLATGGLYSVLLHPMYTCQILITVPGVFLFFNSWLVLLSVVPVFIAFKVFSKEEVLYLEQKFGAAYTDYKNNVRIKFL